MIFYHIIILSLVQGITEFLPISSSGHLVLLHHFFNVETGYDWVKDQTIDVAVHVGTLFSVLVYFKADVMKLFCGLKGLCFKTKNNNTALALHVIIASIPVIIAGAALSILKPSWLHNIELIAWTSIIFGILLWWVDQKYEANKSIDKMTIRHAIGIGLAQSLALIPGTSRSGITMTAARYYGFSRTEAARFSLLLSILAISGAGTLGGIDLIKSNDLSLGLDALLAAIFAFISGLIAITLMMKWLSRATFTPFAIYRIALGVALLGLIYSGTLA